MSSLTLFAFLGLVANRAVAQTGKTTAVCDYAEWTFFKAQSPCQVWANLQAACDPNVSVGPLDTSTNIDATYPAPQGSTATPCQCNVVAYNLMAGCSWCQPNVYSNNWISESQWRAGCSNYDSTGLPSQASSLSNSIPPWALEIENGSPWGSFDASTIAAAGGTPTATSAFGFATGGTSSFRPSTPTGFSAAGPTITGPFSGGDDEDNDVSTTGVGKAVGIAVGIVLGSYLVIGLIVLAVFLTRQKNRKAWYGPTAAYYRNGGRMGDLSAGQPLMAGNNHGAGQSPNPFMSPVPSNNTASPYPPSPYQSTSTPPTHPSSPYQPTTTPPTQPTSPYQPTTTPPTQFDPNVNYSQGYPQYYDPNPPHAPPMGMPQHPGSVPQV